MAEVVVFHHVQGLTDGVRAFADELREAGHTVHTPDMFGGRTFSTIDDGIAFAREQGFANLVEGGVTAADDLPAEVVYIGLKRRRRALRIAGLAFFPISLAKIFLYDLPALSSVTRALSFLAVGAVLLLGGFFYQRMTAARE